VTSFRLIGIGDLRDLDLELRKEGLKVKERGNRNQIFEGFLQIRK